MSDKSLHSSWISQFGLYRYEDNLLKKQRKHSNIYFYGITGTASIIIVFVFIFITNTNFEQPKRLIIFSHENKSYSNQLTTSSAFFKQIPTNARYENEIIFTTPLPPTSRSYDIHTFDDPDNISNTSPHTLELKSFQRQFNQPNLFIHNHNIYPNHRSDFRNQMEEIFHPRPFDYILRGTPPTAFQAHKNVTKFPQIPKEYVGNVNNIQDILRQVRDNNKVSDPDETPVKHKMKIAGTYRHPKVDGLTKMFGSVQRSNKAENSEQSSVQSNSIRDVIRDPFYKFKPNSVSDVNLLATNQFRFAPYGIVNNKFVPLISSHDQASIDPGNLYNQIITANNRFNYLNDKHSKNDIIQIKQKPFTLMLDVYPMPDDDHTSSTTPYPSSLKFRKPFISNMMRHPSIASINNLPMDPSFFHNVNFPQLKGHRYPNVPHYHNDMFFRKFATKKLNSGAHYRPINDEINNPSQITVHLNLFPKKKDRSVERIRNVEILNRQEMGLSEKDDEPNLFSSSLHERMAKLNVKSNKSEDIANLNNITNKVDMEVFRNISYNRNNVILIDDQDTDSSEAFFNKEFIQFQTTTSTLPIETSTESATAETEYKSRISIDSGWQTSIPTIIPIEPRGYSENLDNLLIKPIQLTLKYNNKSASPRPELAIRRLGD